MRSRHPRSILHRQVAKNAKGAPRFIRLRVHLFAPRHQRSMLHRQGAKNAKGAPRFIRLRVHLLAPRHQRSMLHRQGAKYVKSTLGSFGSAFICFIRVLFPTAKAQPAKATPPIPQFSAFICLIRVISVLFSTAKAPSTSSPR